jgi:hypothetical protein
MERGRVRATGSPGDAALHAAIAAVFEQAVSIERIESSSGLRWVAVPTP